MGRKIHKRETSEHYGKGRVKAAELGKGRKVKSALKRETVALDLDALAADLQGAIA